MLANLLLGSVLLFSLIFYILKGISRRSKNAGQSTGRVLQVVLCISILLLIVQDYILAELPHNGTIIATLIAVYIATIIPNRVAVSKEDEEANRKFG